MIASDERALTWARRLAASLPPFTDAETASVGRVLADVSARVRRERHAA